MPPARGGDRAGPVVAGGALYLRRARGAPTWGRAGTALAFNHEGRFSSSFVVGDEGGGLARCVPRLHSRGGAEAGAAGARARARGVRLPR